MYFKEKHHTAVGIWQSLEMSWWHESMTGNQYYLSIEWLIMNIGQLVLASIYFSFRKNQCTLYMKILTYPKPSFHHLINKFQAPIYKASAFNMNMLNSQIRYLSSSNNQKHMFQLNCIPMLIMFSDCYL